jgi:peroxiredoxin Q/BCP
MGVSLASPVPVWAAPASFTVGTDGKQFSAEDARGKFVAVHFLLKTECPLCLRTTQEYLRRADEVAGVRHIFIEPDSESEVATFRKQAAGAGASDADASSLPIYRDPDGALAKQLSIPDGYQFHGVNSNYPALVILDPKGEEVYRHVGKDTTDRVKFDAFAAKMKELSTDAESRHGLSEDKLAIKGYDPVAYFGGAPAKGDAKVTSTYKGVQYRFASAQSRAKFAADPDAYRPQYGGWCATAMADGEKVEINPKSYKITDGKLYLFYDGLLGNAKKDWDKKEKDLTPKADAAWATMLTKDK